MKVGNVVIRRCCRAVAVDQAVRHTDVIVGEVQRFGRRTVGDRFAKQLILIVSPFPGSTEISPSSRGAWKDKTSSVCNIGSPIGVDLLEISDILVREGTVCGVDYHGRI